MGGSTSKTASTIVNNAITDVVSNNYSSCQTTVTLKQSAEQINMGIGIGNTQEVIQMSTISSTCLQNAQKTTQLQNDIANAVDQALKSQSDALSIPGATADAKSKITNALRTNVTTSNIFKQYNEIFAQQTVKQYNIGIQLFGSQKVKQGVDMLSEAVQKLVESTDIKNTVENKLKQSAETTQKGPFDFLGDIFGSLAGIAVIFIIVAGILAYFFLRGGGFGAYQSSGLITGSPSFGGLFGARRPGMPMASQGLSRPTLATQPMAMPVQQPPGSFAAPQQMAAQQPTIYSAPTQIPPYPAPAQQNTQPPSYAEAIQPAPAYSTATRPPPSYAEAIQPAPAYSTATQGLQRSNLPKTKKISLVNKTNA